MSDDESISEGFSASSDEWKPSPAKGGGESSDDDDSDFEECTPEAAVSKRSSQVKSRPTKLSLTKKRKTMTQSLRSRLYQKYRPPPNVLSGHNSPSASTSASASKNVKSPNENMNATPRFREDASDDNSSDTSVKNCLVKPADLDFQSSFFNVGDRKSTNSSPVFDCNVGITNLSDSGSEDNNESSMGEENESRKAFDFRQLLEKANSFERVKESIETRNAAIANSSLKSESTAMDIKSLLALGENNFQKQNVKDKSSEELPPARLSKTKSTRVKRHIKTRPSSTVLSGVGNQSDDSDWEEVADSELLDSGKAQSSLNNSNSLEIHVDLPGRQRATKKDKNKDQLETALRLKINRDITKRQLLLHKSSLLSHFGRYYILNRLLNAPVLMQLSLNLLPSKNAYPSGKTEIKYYQSLLKWYKTAIELDATTDYYSAPRRTSLHNVKRKLKSQIIKKKVKCKEHYVYVFVVLMRAMGIQCRLVVNLQALPLKPAKEDLLSNENFSLEKVKTTQSKRNINKLSETADKSNLQPSFTNKKLDEKNTDKLKIKLKNAESKTNKLSTKEQKKLPAVAEKAEDAATSSLKKLTQQRSQIEEKQAKSTTKYTKQATTDDNQSNKISKDNSAQAQTTRTNAKPAKRMKVVDVGTSVPPKLIINHSSESTNSAQAQATQTNAKSAKRMKVVDIGSSVLPKLIINHSSEASNSKNQKANVKPVNRNKSPSISPKFMMTENIKSKFFVDENPSTGSNKSKKATKSLAARVRISPTFLSNAPPDNEALIEPIRVLRSQKNQLNVPQLDGADDELSGDRFEKTSGKTIRKASVLKSDKKSKTVDRRVLSTDEDDDDGIKLSKKFDLWVEVWSDLEEDWISMDLFTGLIHSVQAIRKSISKNISYVFAFQNDLSLKDITARYCPEWGTIMRKSRVEKKWLDRALSPYLGAVTLRDIRENEVLRHIHESKPMPTTISNYKDHPLYALERHLLKFQGIYPPDAPTLGFIRGEPVYSRDCVHTLHSREIWLKEARTVKLGETPYKIVKARPKWDRLTQTVIKDQPLEIFGYWQTEQYQPPTAENGLVPRNEYGNVELFKECMLPKKTVHLRLSGLNRICKKLGIDCANAVIGFDFHQGSCHPAYDGFVVCEEFAEVVVAAWHEDQAEQDRKEQEKYENRVYGNWKKLIKGLIIRERLKKKYNF